MFLFKFCKRSWWPLVSILLLMVLAGCAADEQARPQERQDVASGGGGTPGERAAQEMDVQAWVQRQRAMHRAQSAQDRQANTPRLQQGSYPDQRDSSHGSWERPQQAGDAQGIDKRSALHGVERRHLSPQGDVSRSSVGAQASMDRGAGAGWGEEQHVDASSARHAGGGGRERAEAGDHKSSASYGMGAVDTVLPGAFGTIEGYLDPGVLEDTLAAADQAEQELYWEQEYEEEDDGGRGAGHAYARLKDTGAAGVGDRGHLSAHSGDMRSGGGHGFAHGSPHGGGFGAPDGFTSKYERQLYRLEEMLWANASMRDIPTAIKGLRLLASQYTSKRFAAGRRPPLDALPALLRARMEGRVVAASPAEESLEWAASHALYVLSVLSATGIASHEHPYSPDRALTELTEAVAAGSMEATAALGARFAAGLGVPRDCQRGLPYLRAVADEVVAVAEYNADFQLPRMEPVRLRDRERDGDYESHGEMYLEEEQVQMEEDLAAHGDMEAQRAMGYRHLVGRGVAQDEGAAVDHLLAAAAAGDGFAALNMGYVYLKGLHTPPDYLRARQFIQQAVDAGVASAYNLMGVLHFNGWGTRQNYTAALQMFETGAALGDPESLYSLGTLHAGGYGVPVSEVTAASYFEEAHMAGHWRAPYTLATLLAQGSPSLARNCTQAVELLRLFIEERGMWPDDMEDAVLVLDEGDAWGALVRFAVIAEQGSAIATGNVAQILKHGRGCQGPPEACHVLAFHAATRAVARGDPEWTVDLGDMHYMGRGTPQNFSAAMASYTVAAAAGLAEGLYSLGYLHEKGHGVERNLSAAAELYWQASQVNAYEAVPALLSWVKVRALQVLQAVGAESALDRLLAAMPGVPGLQHRIQWQGIMHAIGDKSADDKWRRLLISATAGLVGLVLGLWLVRWRRAPACEVVPAPAGPNAAQVPPGAALPEPVNLPGTPEGEAQLVHGHPHAARRRRTDHGAEGEEGAAGLVRQQRRSWDD